MDRQGPEATVIIVDVGKLQAETAEDIFRCSLAYLTARFTRLPYSTDKYGEHHFEGALQRSVRVLTCSCGFAALVKMGSSTTSNHLHDQHGGYNHINIVTPLSRAEVDVLKHLSAFAVEQGVSPRL